MTTRPPPQRRLPEPVTPMLKEARAPTRAVRSPAPAPPSPPSHPPAWASCPTCPDLLRKIDRIELLLEVQGDQQRRGFEHWDEIWNQVDERIRRTEHAAAHTSGEHEAQAQVADREPKWRSANVATIAVLVTALLAGASLLVNLLNG